MTIKIYSDRIDIGDFTLFEGNGGVQFDGVARAENFKGNQSFQGEVAGFSAGGAIFPGTVNTIDKFPFTSTANASDVGDLTQTRYWSAGCSSSTHGYHAGGASPPASNIIDKFPFTTNGNATDVGDLPSTSGNNSSASSPTDGYVLSGGGSIRRFPFATDTNATNVGTALGDPGASNALPPLPVGGVSSSFYGYLTGSVFPSTSTNTIQKFPFSSSSNGSDVGDLTQGRGYQSNQSSSTHGYTSGGDPGAGSWGPPISNVIDKFPFATDTNATDVGDLTAAVNFGAGQSSTTHGFISGGGSGPIPSIVATNTIGRWPFASDTNATDLADLSQSRAYATGTQV